MKPLVRGLLIALLGAAGLRAEVSFGPVFTDHAVLQRLRDEAHRFANTYNADLRSRKIRESILDDLAGLGAVRRAALMGHFGSIDRLRAASPDQIREVPGFGPKLAAELQQFLSRTRDEKTSKA